VKALKFGFDLCSEPVVGVNGSEPDVRDDGVAVLEEEDVVLDDIEGVVKEEEEDIIDPIFEEDEDEDEVAFQVEKNNFSKIIFHHA